MRNLVFVLAAVLILPAAAQAQTFKNDRMQVGPGEQVLLEINGLPSPPPKLQWRVSPAVFGLEILSSPSTSGDIDVVRSAAGATKYTFPAGTSVATFATTGATFIFTGPAAVAQTVGYGGIVSVQASAGSVTMQTSLILSGPADPRLGGDIMASVIGFEQAGASSAESAEKLFIDFFLSRPLPGWRGKNSDQFGPEMRWWGDVRIASYPQQVSGTLTEFVTGFSAKLGAVKVNEIAGYGEFRTGLDFRLASLPKQFFPFIGADRQNSSLSFIVSYGAVGPMHSPTKNIDVFEIPKDPTTPQFAAFQHVFSPANYPALNLAGTKYIAVTPPDRNQFYHQYGGGLRLTTRFQDSHGELLPSPAIVSATIGQNELVSGGRLHGVVGTIEGFYPLPIGPRSTGLNVYLFGRATMALGRKPDVATPLVLTPALLPPDKDGNRAPVPLSDPGVFIVSQASRRDMYTIGVGIDLANFIGKLLNSAN